MIGFFDSGIGGLGILAETKKLLPRWKLIYLADSANIPYGSKDQKRLEKIFIRNTKFLISKGARIIVVACNTATTMAIVQLRKRFPQFSFVGVVPVIKPARRLTKVGKIGILTTPNTARSKTEQELISNFAGDIRVYQRSARGLAKAIEFGESRKVENILKRSLLALVSKKVDILGLGCTHYTLIKDEIRKMVGPDIKVLDSNLAIAKQASKIVLRLRSKPNKGTIKIYATANYERTKSAARKLLGAKQFSFQPLKPRLETG